MPQISDALIKRICEKNYVPDTLEFEGVNPFYAVDLMEKITDLYTYMFELDLNRVAWPLAPKASTNPYHSHALILSIVKLYQTKGRAAIHNQPWHLATGSLLEFFLATLIISSQLKTFTVRNIIHPIDPNGHENFILKAIKVIIQMNPQRRLTKLIVIDDSTLAGTVTEYDFPPLTSSPTKRRHHQMLARETSIAVKKKLTFPGNSSMQAESTPSTLTASSSSSSGNSDVDMADALNNELVNLLKNQSPIKSPPSKHLSNLSIATTPNPSPESSPPPLASPTSNSEESDVDIITVTMNSEAIAATLQKLEVTRSYLKSAEEELKRFNKKFPVSLGDLLSSHQLKPNFTRVPPAFQNAQSASSADAQLKPRHQANFSNIAATNVNAIPVRIRDKSSQSNLIKDYKDALKRGLDTKDYIRRANIEIARLEVKLKSLQSPPPPRPPVTAFFSNNAAICSVFGIDPNAMNDFNMTAEISTDSPTLLSLLNKRSP